MFLTLELHFLPNSALQFSRSQFGSGAKAIKTSSIPCESVTRNDVSPNYFTRPSPLHVYGCLIYLSRRDNEKRIFPFEASVQFAITGVTKSWLWYRHFGRVSEITSACATDAARLPAKAQPYHSGSRYVLLGEFDIRHSRCSRSHAKV